MEKTTKTSTLLRVITDLLLALALLAGLATLALENSLSVLVQLQLVDDDLGGMDSDWHRLSVDLVSGDTLDVDDILETVDGNDLSFTSLVDTADDSNLVVLANWD